MIRMYQTNNQDYYKLAKVRGDELLFVAVSDGELTGYCKYRTADRRVVLLDLFEADNDIIMADGLVRATVAAYRDKYAVVECTDGGMLPRYRKHSGLFTDGNRENIENILQGSCGL